MCKDCNCNWQWYLARMAKQQKVIESHIDIVIVIINVIVNVFAIVTEIVTIIVIVSSSTTVT